MKREMNHKGIAKDELRRLHPCLSDSIGEYGRIHLPVCPACNLSCRYCSRTFCDAMDRPGRSRGILPVEKVAGAMKKALTLCPQITTAGIAGPGDTLASSHALQALRIIDRLFPDMIKCMSTNGLLLAERIDEIEDAKVDALTVTVNAVDPAIQEKIIDGIRYRGEQLTGRDAAALLIDRQLEGIRAASERGILIKVNTVLIPGVNDGHVEEVARVAAAAGAAIHNVIPLIPQARMQKYPKPTCRQIEQARRDAGRHLQVFGHCRHCRADAVGRLGGEDLGSQVFEGMQPAAENFSHG